MKSIGNIYLAWRKDENSPRILVGVLKNNATKGVRFYYLADGAIEARRQGFEAYECFPDVTEVYTDNVLRFFGLRVLKAAQGFKNSEAFFEAWGINSAFKNKPYYMLAYTQGLLESDNFEFLTDFNPRKDFSLVTDICDLKRADLLPGTLQQGDVLHYQTYPNSEDVKLYKDHIFVGKVKAIHARVFQKAKQLKVRVHRLVQGDAIEQIFVRISMD